MQLSINNWNKSYFAIKTFIISTFFSFIKNVLFSSELNKLLNIFNNSFKKCLSKLGTDNYWKNKNANPIFFILILISSSFEILEQILNIVIFIIYSSLYYYILFTVFFLKVSFWIFFNSLKSFSSSKNPNKIIIYEIIYK